MVVLHPHPGGIVRSLILALGLAVAASAAIVTAWVRGETTSVPLQLSSTIDSAGFARIRLARLEERLMRRLAERRVTDEKWERALTFSVTGSAIPVASSYRLSRDGLELISNYPVTPGLRYTAVARPRELYRLAGLDPETQAAPIFDALRLPEVMPPGSAAVTGVYPSSDMVPENLLKFYVEFSRPMREGDAARSIELLDHTGKPVPSAFLGLETELWDRKHRRLTVYLDPGRIKRGLRPNQELGSPLIAGREYRLRVGDAMRDADGAPIQHAFEKRFRAGPADRAQLNPATLKITSPAAGSNAPIVVAMLEAVDFALARRMVWLETQDGSRLELTMGLAKNERELQLTPRQIWASGDYTLVIDARLEDLAGNTFQRPFDADLDDPSLALHDDLNTVRIPVRIAAGKLAKLTPPWPGSGSSRTRPAP